VDEEVDHSLTRGRGHDNDRKERRVKERGERREKRRR
jgi:hypothetical protein